MFDVLTCTELLGYSLVRVRLYQESFADQARVRLVIEHGPTLCVALALHVAQFFFQFGNFVTQP